MKTTQISPLNSHLRSLVAAICLCIVAMQSSMAAEAAAQAAGANPYADETPAQRDARMKWWREARFGMFIHWGVYSVPAGTYKDQQIPDLGEWIMFNAKIPVAEYAAYAKQFNPVKFNADEWVALAKAAGMKYIVITAKHHDGFAMFDTKVDDYNIVTGTPFKRDPLKELSVACQKQGIKLGFYYSQAQDWNHAGGGARPASATRPGGHWDSAQDGDFDAYLKNVAVPQVKELLTGYGPVAVLWYDTPFNFMTPERVAQFLPFHSLQPGLIVNNRLSSDRNTFKGDTETPEQRIPPTGYTNRDWETCMTINDTWGYKAYDTNFKSTETLLRNLIDIASKGGNYLLNVGPTSEGIIPEPEVQRLQDMGKWLQVNGEAIYGTGPTAFGSEAGEPSPTQKDSRGQPVLVPKWEWRCTTKPGKLYIHLLKWPGTKFELADVKGKVSKAYLLADPKHQVLDLTQSEGKVAVTLPATAPDPIASVLCLELETAK